MIVSSLQIEESLQLTRLAPEQLEATLQQTDMRVWLDMQDFKPGEIEPWLDMIGIQGLSRRLCLEAWDRPGFYPLKNEIIMVIPILADPDISHEMDYITFLCRENLLLTLHKKPFMNPQRIIEDIEDSESWLPDRSIAGLISALMIDQSQDSLLRHTTQLRNAISILEKRMEEEPDSVEVEQILELRTELLMLGALVSDQLPAVKALSVTERPYFKIKGAQEYMNCAVANLQAAAVSHDWLDQRLGALRSGFDMYAQDQTNRRLNLLTILSAIFNPATLLAGIWGMNFVIMPELQYPYAYPIALSLMVLIGVLMFLFFRRGGWFD
jgi:magnesium transporter